MGVQKFEEMVFWDSLHRAWNELLAFLSRGFMRDGVCS